MTDVTADPGEEYVAADVNAIGAEDTAADVNAIGADETAADVNAIGADETAADVNAIGADEMIVDDMVGNRTSGGTPAAVLTYVARSLAEEPDAVVVNTDERGRSVRLSLHVAPEDMGRVIGRRGRTAQAIRSVVGAAGARDGVQTSVDIVDD